MNGPSELLVNYGGGVKYFAQVSDYCAALECKKFLNKEGYALGLTTGHALAMGKIIAEKYPKDDVIIVSPDGGELYFDEIEFLINSDGKHKIPKLKKRNL